MRARKPERRMRLRQVPSKVRLVINGTVTRIHRILQVTTQTLTKSRVKGAMHPGKNGVACTVPYQPHP